MKSSVCLRPTIGVLALCCALQSFAESVSPPPISDSKWHQLLAWTHSWDMADAVTYVPDAGEQAAWKIDAKPWVASVPDRGTVGMPLLRDRGMWGQIFSLPSFPDPLYQSSDARFAGRPSFFADPLISLGPDLYNLHSMMSPVLDPNAPTNFFAAPDGYQPPYWIAVLAHPPVGEVSFEGMTSLSAVMDSHRGVTGAGPTVGGTLSGEKWGVACFGPQPPGFFWPDIERLYRAETTLVVVFVGSGIDGSWMEVNWREGDEIRTRRDTITLGARPDGAPLPFEETFFGWAETMRNSAMGIKLGQPAEADIEAIRNWSAPFITEG